MSKKSVPRRLPNVAAAGIRNAQLAALVVAADPARRLALARQVQEQIERVVMVNERLQRVLRRMIDAGITEIVIDGEPLGDLVERALAPESGQGGGQP